MAPNVPYEIVNSGLRDVRRTLLPSTANCNTEFATDFRNQDKGTPTLGIGILVLEGACVLCPVLEICQARKDMVQEALGAFGARHMVVAAEIIDTRSTIRAVPNMTPDVRPPSDPQLLLADMRAAFREHATRPYSRLRHSPYAEVMVALCMSTLLLEFGERFPKEDLAKRIDVIIHTASQHDEKLGAGSDQQVFVALARQYLEDVLQLRSLKVPNAWNVALHDSPQKYRDLQAYRKHPTMTDSAFYTLQKNSTKNPEGSMLAYIDSYQTFRGSYPELPSVVLAHICSTFAEPNQQISIDGYLARRAALQNAGYAARRGFTESMLVEIALHSTSDPIGAAQRQEAVFAQLCVEYADDEEFGEWEWARIAHGRHFSIEKVRDSVGKWRQLYHDFRRRFETDAYAEDWLIRQSVFLRPRNPLPMIRKLSDLNRMGVLPRVTLQGAPTSQDIVATTAIHNVEGQDTDSATQRSREVLAGWAATLTVNEQHALALTYSLEWLLPDDGASVRIDVLCAYFNVADEAALRAYTLAVIVPKLQVIATGRQ